MSIEENDFFLRFYNVKLKKMEENKLKKNLGVMENEKKNV